ncbi:membrane hypothetical protein [metagenome]|uniref:Glycosyltransferase RgtA/B/C/D-like domain-containing protein n=1 Tax=metagenome TaxID=256318 RepID=A0A2P2CDU1_9ZZZZ
MITWVVRRVVPLVGLAVVLGSIIRGQHVPGVGADAWFHLRFGEEFLGGWSLRDPGHLGVYDNAEWLPTQWLSQVAMAWVHDRAGIAGVMTLAGVLALALTVGLYLACRLRAAPLPAVIATAVGMMAASPGLSARPQLVSYLFVTATVAAWLATVRDGRPRYWVVALAWLWPMLHGMWLVGISVSVVAVVGLVLQRELALPALLRCALIPVLSLVVSMLNPLGFSVVRSIVDVGGRSDYFAEWGPTDFTAPAAALLAVMIALALLGGLRSGPVPWAETLLALLGVAWALFSLRTTPVAALILAPILAGAIQSLVPDRQPVSRGEGVAVAALFLAGCVTMAVVAGHRSSEQVVADWVDTRLGSLPSGTKVLDDWATGSYLLHNHPELQLVMHGYGDVFTDAEIRRNADLVRLQPEWDRVVADLDPDVALLDPGSALGYAVEHQLGWTRVEGDEELVLLTPPRP